MKEYMEINFKKPTDGRPAIFLDVIEEQGVAIMKSPDEMALFLAGKGVKQIELSSLEIVMREINGKVVAVIKALEA